MPTFKPIGTGHDFQKVAIIKDFLLNPLSTTDRTTLGGTLGAGNEGLPVYDITLDKLFIWDGTDWMDITGTPASGFLKPIGGVAFNATEPASPAVGDLYWFTTAGTNTWEGSNDVEVGDQAWWDGTAWKFVEASVAAASETVAGYVELATQAEVNTGTDDVRAITPLKLASKLSNYGAAKVFFQSGVSLVADTPFTVTHNLALQNRNAFILKAYVSNSEYEVDTDSTSINACTATSSKSVTADIVVIGF